MSCSEDCECKDGKLGCFAFVLGFFVVFMLIGTVAKWVRDLEQRVDKIEQSRPK